MPVGELSDRWPRFRDVRAALTIPVIIPVEGNQPMPKLAANLHYMFDEVPFLTASR
jgi:hypothetical protein